MESIQPTINVSGTILNMAGMGFNHLNRICELIENSISAGAKCIRLITNTKTNVMTYVDNACGMDEKGLFQYGTLNNRMNATKTSHGCYGIGGKHSLTGLTDNGKCHIISKPKNSSTICEMKINYCDAIKNGVYQLIPHEASRSTEDIWNTFSFDRQSSGTVQCLESTSNIVNELSSRIATDDITKNSIRFELGCIYNKEIQKGLNLELICDGKSYVISAIDRLKYDQIEHVYKQRTVVTAYKYPDSSYRFYYTDGNNVSYYRNCSSTLKGKSIKDLPPIIESSSLIRKIGDITIQSTYSKEWDLLQNPDLLKMNLKIRAYKEVGKPIERDLQGGTVYERNGKQIAHFPTKLASTAKSDLIEYFRDSHHSISFEANDEMDGIFKVQVNKSKLTEDNIHKDLFGTTTFICETFIKNMEKLSGKSVIEAAASPAPASAKAPTTASAKAPAPAPAPAPASAPAPAPAPASAKTPIPTLKSEPVVLLTPAPTNVPTKPLEKKTATSVTSAVAMPLKTPVAVSIPVVNEPKTSISPIAKPVLKVEFSKTDTLLLVHYMNEIKAKIPYTGQYNIQEKYYNEALMKLGEERFMEWIMGREKLGLYEYDSKFFS